MNDQETFDKMTKMVLDKHRREVWPLIHNSSTEQIPASDKPPGVVVKWTLWERIINWLKELNK